jgi:hypothetical protein
MGRVLFLSNILRKFNVTQPSTDCSTEASRKREQEVHLVSKEPRTETIYTQKALMPKEHGFFGALAPEAYSIRQCGYGGSVPCIPSGELRREYCTNIR